MVLLFNCFQLEFLSSVLQPLGGEYSLYPRSCGSVRERKTGTREPEGGGRVAPVSQHTQALERRWGQGERMDVACVCLTVKVCFIKNKVKLTFLIFGNENL